jgi:hypothetical protein
MKRLYRVLRIVAVMLLANSSLSGAATSELQIAPVQAVLHFSSHSRGQTASVPIKTTRGVTVYVLTLAKESNLDPEPSELELFLRNAHEGAEGWNFFYPPGTNWHGMQPWFLPADDFAHGVGRTLYGPVRVFDLKWLGIVVQIKLLKADLKPIRGSEPDYEFKSLDMLVRIHSMRS